MLSQKETKSKSRISIGDEELTKMLTCIAAGMSVANTTTVTGMSQATVGRVAQAEKIIRTLDWDAAKSFIKTPGYMKYLEAASKWYGIAIPDEVLHPEPKLTPAQLLTVELPEVKPAEAPAAKQNEDLYLAKLIETLVKQNELLEQLMDVVLPKYIGDLKDNLNANTDLISERLKTCECRLEKIAVNTRKRGA